MRRAIYRKSDAVTSMRLPRPGELQPLVAVLRRALAMEERRTVEAAAAELALGLAGQHELGHHLDYERLALADSFHTEGFFRRESSLFHQLVPEAGDSRAGGSPAGPQ